MTVVNDGKNRIRDLLIADLDTASLGTDSTAPTVGDTDLVSEDATTNASMTVTTGNKLVNTTHILLSTIGVGTDYKEFGVYVNGGSTLLSRVVFPTFSQSANTELHTTTIFRIN